MFITSGLRALFKQQDHTADDVKPTIEAVKGFREFVFTTIESLIILAGLEIALSKEGAVWLWVVYVIAWLALMFYLITYARFSINALAERFNLAHRNRDVFLWVAGTLSVLASFAVTNLVPAVTAAFITSNFMK